LTRRKTKKFSTKKTPPDTRERFENLQQTRVLIAAEAWSRPFNESRYSNEAAYSSTEIAATICGRPTQDSFCSVINTSNKDLLKKSK
jgi:hypothetical protein